MTPATSTQAPTNGEQVVAADLHYICERLDDEFSAMGGKRLLITGGAGFLGYYLVQAVAAWNRDRTAAERIQMTVLDNYSRGKPEWLLGLADEQGITLAEHDMIQPLPEEMGHFEYVVHAASVASPIYYRKHPIETMDANVNGLRHLLERWRSAQDAGLELGGFLFYSTSEVYGDPLVHPQPESYRGNVNPTGPRACYDEGKRCAEALFMDYYREHDVDIRIARIFNTYGP
ncbi:MAG: NAD-dependent epimerase/dehydratase family protein, partial [Gemmatimonadetes bacterium]|nr:NAD-dependent epimerase/dehydratase family protein [Gemmatimonadota bacterium]